MKKDYTPVNIELIFFETEDIIITSDKTRFGAAYDSKGHDLYDDDFIQE